MLLDSKQTHLPVQIRDRVHVLSQSSTDRVDAELSSFVDYARVYEVYVWVHKAISVITEALAPLPVIVIDADGETQDAHPLTELFGYVNDEWTPVDLWGVWLVHMLLGGESFLHFVSNGRGVPTEVWPRRPDLVGIVPDKGRGIYYPAAAKYVFDPTKGGYSGTPLEIAPEEMCHLRFPNPLNPYRGLSPARAIQAGITIDIFAQAWAKTFLKRGARPDYALIAPQGLTPTEREGYEAKLYEKFQGYENWHKPIVLEDGVTDVKIFSWPPKDIEWLQQRELSRDEVGGLYGVPDEVMGYGRDTYENFEKAFRWFMSLTVMGLARRRDTTLTAFFHKRRAMLRPGERIITDTSGVGVLQEDKTPRIEQAKVLWAMGIPFNLLDERLGLEIGPVPGGDVGYVPFNLIPVGGAPEMGGAAATTPQRKALSPAPEYGTPSHKAMWKERTGRYMPHERRMAAKLLEDFDKQKADVLAELRAFKGVASTDATALPAQTRLPRQAGTLAKRGAGAGKQAPPGYPTDVNDIFNRENWDAWFGLMYEIFYTDVVRASGEAEMARFSLEMPFDLGDPRVQRAILEMRIKFANDINETTQEAISTVLREVLAEADRDGGWAAARIQAEMETRISNVFETRKTAYERERIARTEMHKASEIGNYEGATQAGRVAGLTMYKAWLAALDGRERPTHREAHFTYYDNPIGIDDVFEVGMCRGTSPGNTGCPEEDINCRCAALYYAREAEG